VLARDELSTASTSIITFSHAETFDVSPPVHTDSYSPSVAERIGTFSCEQPFVCTLSDATLLGPDGVTVTTDGRYIMENSLTSEVKLAYGLRRALPSLVRPPKRLDRAISLVGPRVTNYFHWFVDYLPKIQGLQAYEDVTESLPTLLIPPNPPAWLYDSLDVLGYADQVVEWTSGRARVDELVVPTGAYDSAHLVDSPRFRSPARLRWLRSQVTAAATLSEFNDHSKYVYISRADATIRQVHNESSVLAALPSEFRSYTLSDLSLREQIGLFANAEMVVAPHGAGLTNMLWGTDLTVIELWGVKDTAVFFEMSTGLEHTHSRLECVTNGKELCVDIDDLVDRIDRLRGC
jgi:capsular polysaccharide biosynthesis protein